MTFKDFYTRMIPFVVFSYENIRAVFGGIDRRRLFEWTQKGYLSRVSKGVFTFPEFSESETLPLLISNHLYEPSYISLEYVLSENGFIPEGVFTYTGVSTLKTASFQTPFGNFNYRNIKPELFYGYKIRSIPIYINGRRMERFVKVATLEKALFDFIYFRNGLLTERDVLGFRFDDELMNQLDLNVLFEFCSKVRFQTTEKNIQKILATYVIH